MENVKDVKNVPEYAKNKKYIVARVHDCDLWFWGAWNDYTAAYEAAREISGVVIVNEGV